MEVNAINHSKVPSAFLCTQSGEVMDNPFLNLCGHIFDQKAFDLSPNCPFDNEHLDKMTCIPFNELKGAIFNWKVQQGADTNFLQIDGRAPPSELDLIEQKLFNVELTEEPIKPTASIVNAHSDDIHAMISSRNGFITGSKDTTINMWNAKGECIKTLQPQQSQGYKSWVTAMHRFSNDYWAYGTRDGKLVVLDQKGNEIRNMLYSPSEEVKGAYNCKVRNKTRINCITELYSNDSTTKFYIGTPQYIHLFDAKSTNLLTSHFVHKNDWVYCIEPLKTNRLAIVYGSTLQIWNMPPHKKIWRENLIVAPYNTNNNRQREHISSIAPIYAQSSLACAVFDGSVRVVDIANQETYCFFKEHEGRVWSVLEIDNDVIVSSADDRTIKVWDLRKKNSVRTIVGGDGRVSTLLRLNELTLLSGSCPDDVYKSVQKATIAFWDLRTFTAYK